MKPLDLNAYGVREMNNSEVVKVDGGVLPAPDGSGGCTPIWTILDKIFHHNTIDDVFIF